MSDTSPPVEEGTSPPVQGGLFGVAANALAAIGTIWIFLLMFLIVADVVGRNFLNRPITGVAEIAARSVVAIVFLQLSAGILAGRMTRADFVVNYLQKVAPGFVRALDILFALVGAAVFAAITYASWPEMTSAWRTREFFGVQGIFTIPTLPFRAIIVIGSIAAIVSYLILAFHMVVSARRAAEHAR